jgi:hypothetical protein
VCCVGAIVSAWSSLIAATTPSKQSTQSNHETRKSRSDDRAGDRVDQQRCFVFHKVRPDDEIHLKPTAEAGAQDLVLTQCLPVSSQRAENTGST